MAIVKTLAKGQIVIPAEIRKKYNIKPGTKLQVFDREGVIYLIPVAKDPIEAACGFLKGDFSLAEDLLKARREELEREEKARPR